MKTYYDTLGVLIEVGDLVEVSLESGISMVGEIIKMNDKLYVDNGLSTSEIEGWDSIYVLEKDMTSKRLRLKRNRTRRS